MKRELKTLTMAVVAALMLILAAAPASATPVSFVVKDGLFDTVAFDLDLDPATLAPPPPCGLSAGTVTSDIVASGPNWTSNVTALQITNSVSAGGSAYIVELSRDAAGPNTGTILANGTVTHSLKLLMNIYATTGTPPSCVKGAQVCRVRVTFTGSLSGVATPAPPAASGDFLRVTGSGNVTAVLGQPCGAPWATLIGSTATFIATDPLKITV